MEVMVALTIAAIAAIAIFAVFTSIFAPQADLTVYTAAETSFSSLSDALGRYVSADTSVDADAPNSSWKLPGDSCAYALEMNCLHDAASFLDPLIVQKRPGATLTYTVASDAGTQALNVTMSLSWP